MIRRGLFLGAALICAASLASAQGGGGGGRGGRGGGGGGGGGRGGRGGRGPVRVMTLSSPAMTDGAAIPLKYSQAGAEVSPPLEWTGGPDTVTSYVLLVHDMDAATGNGTDDLLHWLVWNIPGSAHGLGEAVPQGPQLADGTRQISVTGPYYRGPAAPANGPAHHYAFEVFALDTVVAVEPVGQPPAATRAAVVAAMANHVRGKGAMVVMFRRN